MEFTICTPRQFLPFANDTANGTLDNLPAQIALLDYAQNTTLLNAITPVNVPSAIDTSTDLMFRLGSSCRTLHYKWKCAKPVRILLQPGQQVDFVVNIPAFKFTNSDWNNYVTAAGVLPEFLPFATVVLDVRTKSEIVHNADYTKVQFGSGTYTHVQQEYHNIQACPYQPQNNMVTINNLDSAIANADQLVINPLTEEEVAMTD